MNTYKFPMPRAAFAFCALAMSALTIGVLVVLPSRMESDSQAYALFAASRAAQCANVVPTKCAELVGIDEPIGREVALRANERHCDARS